MQCETLEQYVATYGELLGAQAQQRLRPRYDPGRDQPLHLNCVRTPLPAQSHVISAMVRHLEKHPTGWIIANMGTGKSLIASAIVDAFHRCHSRRPYRCLVLCPPHLVTKWPREIAGTVPDARVVPLDHFRQLLDVSRYPACSEWYILSEVAAKLGPSWRPAACRDRRGGLRCSNCGHSVMRRDVAKGIDIPLRWEDLEKSRTACGICESPLWQWVHDLDKWPISRFIRDKRRGWFDYLITDEAHQYQGDASARSMSMAHLVGATRRNLCLTGTLAGGYADDLRTFLFRTNPRTLLQEGIGWKDVTPFNERYGRIETTTIVRESKHIGPDNTHSLGKAQRNTRKTVKPGIMPTLFGRHLMDKACFLSLDQMAEDLPPFQETVHGARMDAEQAQAYEMVELSLASAVKEMMRAGNRKLLGKMLHTLLGYPDHPWGYGEIGYLDDFADPPEWVTVVDCPDLDREVVRPKEHAFVSHIASEVQAGRKCWGYVQMSETRDVLPRLESLLMAQGLRVAVLRATKVATTKREAWISKMAPRHDVILSHPKVVETGVDFFDAQRSFNIPSIAFYQTGYSVYTLRQAARRAWRIAQWEPCRVDYFYYEQTMQARALSLLAKKTRESEMLEGTFSAEGMAALVEEDDGLAVALAKSLVERLDDLDPSRHWAKVKACGVAV